MGRMGLRAALGLACAGLLACSDPKLERMTQVRDEVCKCRDAACVDAALAKLPADGPRAQRRAQRLAADIVRCVAQVGELDPAPPGGAPPPAEAPTEAPPKAPAEARTEASSEGSAEVSAEASTQAPAAPSTAPARRP